MRAESGTDANAVPEISSLSTPAPSDMPPAPPAADASSTSGANDHFFSKTAETRSSGPPPIKKTLFRLEECPHHVIFVVHGMGRQLEEFGNYERNVGYLVENTKTVLQSQFHDLKTDVHIIPIEWHSKLHSMVDQRMSLATLRTVPKVRLVMNDYFADILYYFNNHYGSEIIRMIVDELNEAYSTFMVKHQDFNGKISVYALSLGGVAMYDILTCMDDDDPEERPAKESWSKSRGKDSESRAGQNATATEPAKRTRIRKQDQPKFRAVVPKLRFRPDFLFTVGSPVGAVMVMRNLEWETFHPPDDIVHHNLFHPFDPLAYRIEPLIDPIFAAIPAVTLTSTGNSQLFPISLPSLPSLPLPSIPGSISSFWESKVPALPRPTIPTLSTISQMTQSLKAGRWIPGGVASTSDRGSGASTPTVGGHEQKFSASKDENLANESENKERKLGLDAEKVEPGMHRPHHKSHPLGRTDNTSCPHVSVTEAIAAATAATYLDQRATEGDGNDDNTSIGTYMEGEEVSTTTGSAGVVAGSPRRPTIGPRRVSSRVEDDGSDEDEDSEEPSSSITMASDPRDVQDLPPLHMEYYLGLEKGPTAEEKAQGEGAKSDVVQETTDRSVPTSPVLGAHSGQAHEHERASVGQTEKPVGEKGLEVIQVAHQNKEQVKLQDTTVRGAEEPKKARKVTISEEAEEAGKHDQVPDEAVDNKSNDSKGDIPSVDTECSPVHVGGRATKVPYRIDHVLQETKVDQYTNEYLLGMRSHFRYWGNRDIAYHILRTMLRQDGGGGGSSEEGFLNLQPEMPAPVTAPKNAKVAAEAKAKAAAAAYRRQSQDQDRNGPVHHGHRKSSSFSFLYSSTATLSDVNQSTHRGYGYGEEEEQLYGYRYSDLDMSSAANVSFSGNTLYQNSPFMSSSSSVNSSASSRGMEARAASSSSLPGVGAGGKDTGQRENRRRSVGLEHEQEHERKQRHGAQRKYGQEQGKTGWTASKDDSLSTGSPAFEFEEGVVVPDLALPPRLHHRSSRVEEKL
ncbi:hypothetical protein BGX28_009786 [Mortierella sp. GBA30]|nr:hypothetical protein BGX28_009786 [Mortierella sp. GBA30]